jgi:ribosomal-protein-alanine N-acetyltransferase
VAAPSPAERRLAARVELRPWETLEPAACLEFNRRNSEHVAPWEPRRPAGFLTLDHQAALQRRVAQERLDDRAYAYAVFLDGDIVGRIALSDVARGAFQSAHVGYMTDVAFCGRGVATESLRQLLGVAFTELALHRVQAAVIPRNAASMRVVAKCELLRIGMSPRYLRIDDRWEDHVLYAITAEDFPPG